MNLQVHSDYMEVSSSLNVTILSGLVAMDIVVVEDIFLVYLVASRDHVFKSLCNFLGGSFSQ